MAAPPFATLRPFLLACIATLACAAVFTAHVQTAAAANSYVRIASADEVDGDCGDWSDLDSPDCEDSGSEDDGSGDWGDWDDGSGDDSGDDGGDTAPVIQWPAPPKGAYAKLRANKRTAVAPKGAPKPIKAMIRAANSITKKPYKWGGGHTRWYDKGYDCSGAVSFVLRAGGYLNSPLASGGLAKWGASGAGNWVRIYANKKHVFVVIAGLRFDTSAYGGGGGDGPRWRASVRPTKGFKLRHPKGL